MDTYGHTDHLSNTGNTSATLTKAEGSGCINTTDHNNCASSYTLAFVATASGCLVRLVPTRDR